MRKEVTISIKEELIAELDEVRGDLVSRSRIIEHYILIGMDKARKSPLLEAES